MRPKTETNIIQLELIIQLVNNTVSCFFHNLVPIVRLVLYCLSIVSHNNISFHHVHQSFHLVVQLVLCSFWDSI